MTRERFFTSPRTGRPGSLVLTLVVFLLAALPRGAVAEFQVNRYTSHDQSAPAVAMDGSGGFVVVWEAYDQDGGGDGVFGKRYDSTGTPIGVEFQVNAYTRSRQGSPSVAVHGDGDFVVVWTGGGENDYSGVFGRRYDSAANPLGTDFQVNTYTSSYQGGAVVSADGEGGFVVVWVGYGGGNYTGVFGQRYDSGGNPLGTNFQVNTYTSVAQNDPAVAAGGGGFVVVWSNYGQTYGEYFGVFGQRYDNTGTAVGVEFQVNTYTIYSLDEEFRLAPAVAMHGRQNFVVVWNGYDEYYSEYAVFGRRYDGAGTPQGRGEFRVSTTPLGDIYPYPGDPAVAADGSGGFVVVWENYAGEFGYYGVLGRRYNSTGAPQGDEFQINQINLSFDDSYYLRDPAIAANGAGGFVVVWDNYGPDGDGYGVFGILLCGNGQLEPGEQCDDGERVAGDGCDAGCRVETCFNCAGEPSLCTPLTCPDDTNPCTDDVCNPETGTCYAPTAEATLCDDGNGCTQTDSCIAGLCVGADLVACTEVNQCHEVGVCDPGTGLCSNPLSPDGIPCDDSDDATVVDQCHRGSCVGSFTQLLKDPCEDLLPPKLKQFMDKKARRTEKFLKNADKAAAKAREKAARGKDKVAKRLDGKVEKYRGKAEKQLDAILKKVEKAFNATKAGKQISEPCTTMIGGLVGSRKELIGGFVF